MSGRGIGSGVRCRAATLWVTAVPCRRSLLVATSAGAVMPAFAQRSRPLTGGLFVSCWPTPRVDRRGFPVYRVLAGGSAHG